MTAARVSASPGAIVGRVRHHFPEIESTQAVIASLAAAGAPEGTVVTADHQRSGRGRLGRTWWDEPGASVLLSVLLRPALAAGEAAALSLMAAVAVTDALRNAVGLDAGISWPNDILLGGRKVAGILVEGQLGAAARLDHVRLGIGINVNQDSFPAPVAARATSLRLVSGRAHARGAVTEAVVSALDRRYAEFQRGGFAVLRHAWRERSVTLSRPVRLPDGTHGVAEDVGDDGALLVRGQGEVVRLTSGELVDAPAA